MISFENEEGEDEDEEEPNIIRSTGGES